LGELFHHGQTNFQCFVCRCNHHQVIAAQQKDVKGPDFFTIIRLQMFCNGICDSLIYAVVNIFGEFFEFSVGCKGFQSLAH